MYSMVHSKVDENFPTTRSRGNGSGLKVDYGAELNSAPHTTFRFQFGVQEGCFVKLILIFRVYTEILRISDHYRSKVV